MSKGAITYQDILNMDSVDLATLEDVLNELVEKQRKS